MNDLVGILADCRRSGTVLVRWGLYVLVRSEASGVKLASAYPEKV